MCVEHIGVVAAPVVFVAAVFVAAVVVATASLGFHARVSWPQAPIRLEVLRKLCFNKVACWVVQAFPSIKS